MSWIFAIVAMYAPPDYAAHVSEFWLRSRSLAFDDLRWLPAEGPCGLEQFFFTHAHVSLLLISYHALYACFTSLFCASIRWKQCAMDTLYVTGVWYTIYSISAVVCNGNPVRCAELLWTVWHLPMGYVMLQVQRDGSTLKGCGLSNLGWGRFKVIPPTGKFTKKKSLDGTPPQAVHDISSIGSMYGIDAKIWCILMVNMTIYGIHGSYG